MPVFSKARSDALAARVAAVLGGQVKPARMSFGLLTTARHVVKAQHAGMQLEVYVFEPWLEVWIQNFRLRGPEMSFAVNEPNRLMTLTEPVAGATLAGRPLFRRPWQPDEARVRAFAAEAGHVEAVQRLSLAPGESLTVLPAQITARLRAGDEAQIRERFEALAGLVARAARPPAAAPAEIAPHAVVAGEPGGDASPHRFGGTITEGPDCRNCRRPLHQILSLDTGVPPLSGPLRGLPRVPVATCLSCQTSSPLVLAHRDGRWGILEQAANRSFDDFPATLPARPVRLEPAASPEGHRLGGAPDWIQSDETPDCTGCGEVMAFLAQVETDDRLGLQFGDEGRLYAFVCPRCVSVATLIQSH